MQRSAPYLFAGNDPASSCQTSIKKLHITSLAQKGSEQSASTSALPHTLKNVGRFFNFLEAFTRLTKRV
jgi:hypothetical protein